MSRETHQNKEKRSDLEKGISMKHVGRKRWSRSKVESKSNRLPAIQPDREKPEKPVLYSGPTNSSATPSLPGAISVSGPGESNVNDTILLDVSENRQAQPVQRDYLVNATLVHDEDELHLEQAEIIKDRPWRRRCGLLVLIVLVVFATIAVAVPLTAKRNHKDDDFATLSPAPSTSFPTVSPTTSPAPTSVALVTVVIQLDDKPEETAWRLDCSGRNVANFPFGVYQNRANRLVTEQFPVQVGDDCAFTIFDSGRDGLDQGFFRVHFGEVYLYSATQLLGGSGEFTNEVSIDFTMEAPPTSAPTISPTAVPTFSQEPSSIPSFVPTQSVEPTISPSFSPTTVPTITPTNFVPVSTEAPTAAVVAPGPPRPAPPPPPPGGTSAPVELPTTKFTIAPVPTPSPTTAPTRSPTYIPTSSPSLPVPTSSPSPEYVAVDLTIQLDEIPSETGWNLACSGIEYAVVPPNFYGEPKDLITSQIDVPYGSECIFTVTDVFGDGMCCQTGEGFYRLTINDRVVAEGGKFQFEESKRFVAI